MQNHKNNYVFVRTMFYFFVQKVLGANENTNWSLWAQTFLNFVIVASIFPFHLLSTFQNPDTLWSVYVLSDWHIFSIVVLLSRRSLISIRGRIGMLSYNVEYTRNHYRGATDRTWSVAFYLWLLMHSVNFSQK